MQKYSDYAPTACDQRGLNADRLEIGDWLVALSVNRDSEACERSNWAVITKDLAKFVDDIETHEFGHWACGWFRLLLVRPGTAAAEAAEEWENALSQYPIASDEHFSELEYDEACEAWAQMSLRERVALCQRCRISVFAARRDELPSDDTGALLGRLRR